MYGYSIDELAVGMTATFSKTVTDADLVLFAGVTGDTNPVHIDADYAAGTMFGSRIAHGMLSAGFISAVLGTRLPGPGCIYLSQTLKFRAPVRVGDTVEARVEVIEIDPAKRRIKCDTRAVVGETVVVEGEASMMVPAAKSEAVAAE